MRAKAYPLLEQTIEDGIRSFLLNRVNKYQNRVEWVRQEKIVGYMDIIDGPTVVVPEMETAQHISSIAEEAADYVMTFISEAFTFTDDEAVVPQEDEGPQAGEPLVASGGEWARIQAYDQGRTDGENRIIAFLERVLSACARAVDECVDTQDFAGAAINADRMAHIDSIIDRIKADEVVVPSEDDQESTR